MMERVSKNITLVEATKSQTATRRGIDNTPNEKELSNMRMVAEACFQPLREWWGKAIGISSFFRSDALNEAIGGSKTSQHSAGAKTGLEEAAIDIDADIYNNGITNAEIFYWLKENVDFDQLIWEFGTNTNPNWVHIGYKKHGNRKQILRAIRKNGRTSYIPFD